MSIFAAASYEHVQAFTISLGIGLLIGIERERRTDPKAGLRTFALVGMLGCLSALIADHTSSGWIVAVGLLAIAAMMIAALVTDPQDDGDPGTTSIVALMICYGLGAAVWFGYTTLAVMAAITTTVLLYFKTQLHGISASLSHKDLVSILQFAVLSLVVLPILPDVDLGPYDAFNPRQVWWMVVLIAGVSLAGYAALRLIGSKHGAALIGVFGGLASSTATTMVFARHARDNEDVARTATLVILLANLAVIVRLGLVSAVVAPQLTVTLAAILLAGLLPGLALTLYGWRQIETHGDLPLPEMANPTEMKTALTFGLIYGGVLLLAAWLQDIAGSRGLYVAAVAAGLTDVDAIVLSSLRLFNLDKLGEFPAVVSIVLACIANLAFKMGLVVSIGGGALARRTLPGLAAIGAGLGIGLVFFA